MSEGKHTPGPWRYGACAIVGADNASVVYCELARPMKVEDARLIAAAPELLEHLKNITTRFERCMRFDGNADWAIQEATKAARAAIAKAEGRQE